VIETARLLLRAWRDEDAAAHHAIANDPRVVATLGRAPSLADSTTVVARQGATLAANGFCLWAAERRDDRRMIGWCGLQPGRAPIEGDVEIGWTLAPALWGQGYAREAATATLAWAWANTGLERVVAITTPGNTRSWGLMERLGMTRVAGGDFDHPALAEGDPLRPHLTYAIERPRQG
jgi:RimJ/RimL family protein N-acetyltransferase